MTVSFTNHLTRSSNALLPPLLVAACGRAADAKQSDSLVRERARVASLAGARRQIRPPCIDEAGEGNARGRRGGSSDFRRGWYRSLTLIAHPPHVYAKPQPSSCSFFLLLFLSVISCDIVRSGLAGCGFRSTYPGPSRAMSRLTAPHPHRRLRGLIDRCPSRASMRRPVPSGLARAVEAPSLLGPRKECKGCCS